MNHTWLLVLKIDASYYRLEPIIPDDDGRTLRAWKLHKNFHKGGKQQYTVSLDRRHGPHCDCRDFIHRRANTPDRECKHVASLRALTLLEPIHGPIHTARANDGPSV